MRFAKHVVAARANPRTAMWLNAWMSAVNGADTTGRRLPKHCHAGGQSWVEHYR